MGIDPSRDDTHPSFLRLVPLDADGRYALDNDETDRDAHPLLRQYRWAFFKAFAQMLMVGYGETAAAPVVATTCLDLADAGCAASDVCCFYTPAQWVSWGGRSHQRMSRRPLRRALMM